MVASLQSLQSQNVLKPGVHPNNVWHLQRVAVGNAWQGLTRFLRGLHCGK
jgi:hypothetical protein